eukprot:GHVU01164802.1.p2 GENE.GHVU01164802.1~~GHVU01164802.1.p2  ORF type:complete len:102 (+),score=14.08 GHVU01164802.1:548-853(+)
MLICVCVHTRARVHRRSVSAWVGSCAYRYPFLSCTACVPACLRVCLQETREMEKIQAEVEKLSAKAAQIRADTNEAQQNTAQHTSQARLVTEILLEKNRGK